MSEDEVIESVDPPRYLFLSPRFELRLLSTHAETVLPVSRAMCATRWRLCHRRLCRCRAPRTLGLVLIPAIYALRFLVSEEL